MRFDRFAEEVSRFWNAYFAWVRQQQRAGNLETNGRDLLYPTMLLLVKAGPQYVAELLGASPEWKPLLAKRMKAKSAQEYFNQFPVKVEKPSVIFNARNTTWASVVVSADVDIETVAKRFPQVTGFESTLLGKDSEGGVIAFGDKFESHSFQRCMLVNKFGDLVRCKFILQAIVVAKAMQPAGLSETLRRFTRGDRIVGAHSVEPNTVGRLEIAGHLQSLYLSNPHETTIGAYLCLHERVLLQALNAQRILFEPAFDWIERPEGCDDNQIRPDLLVQNADGRWDIYDLKRALTKHDNITTGGFRRRRLIAPAYEGVSQLANYRAYFESSANAAHALERHGVVIERPRLVLVVGSLENVIPAQIAQARRALGTDLEILDYDTLCSRIIGPESGGATAFS